MYTPPTRCDKTVSSRRRCVLALRTHLTLATLPCWKFCKESCLQFLGPCTSNLKSVTLTTLEQLAFNAQKFRGYLTLIKPPFEKFLRGHARTIARNMQVKFEVRSIECIGLFQGLAICAHTETRIHKQNHHVRQC